MTAATARPRTAMKRLAGVLAFVCLVLFLLAIEQKHAVAAWETVRAGAGPAAGRVADWAGDLPPRAAGAFAGLRSAVARQTASWADSPRTEAASGKAKTGATAGEAEFAVAVGSMTMVGAEVRFGNGEVLHTRPLRIAYGRDAFAPGQTFAARLNVPADAQIELREVVAPAPGQLPPSSLCGGEPARAAALLQRRDQIQLMLFRTRTIGPATPSEALCGVWSFPTR